MATVWIPSLLRDLTGGQPTVTAAGSTVREIVETLDRAYPGMQKRLCDEHSLRPGMSVVVDAQVAPLGLLAKVGDHSEVHFLPAIGGG